MSRVILISVVVLALVITAGLVLRDEISTAQDFELEGVPREDLERKGVVLEAPNRDDHPVIDAATAQDVAIGLKGPDAAVREVELARWGGETLTSVASGQLIWIVNFDPDSVGPPPALSGTISEPSRDASGDVDPRTFEYVLVAIDASTGEFLFETASIDSPE